MEKLEKRLDNGENIIIKYNSKSGGFLLDWNYGKQGLKTMISNECDIEKLFKEFEETYLMIMPEISNNNKINNFLINRYKAGGVVLETRLNLLKENNLCVISLEVSPLYRTKFIEYNINNRFPFFTGTDAKSFSKAYSKLILLVQK